MAYILHRGAEYLASDSSALALCALATVQVFHGVHVAGGLEEAFKLVSENPMFGGAPNVREGGLPMFTYALGHALREFVARGRVASGVEGEGGGPP